MLVAHLATKPGFLARETGLLPSGVGLIVSYPTSDTIQGVNVAVQSDGILSGGQKVSGGFFCAATSSQLTPCSNLQNGESQRVRLFLAPDTTPETRNSDLSYYTSGYVTIVPITSNLTADNPLVFKSMLSGFAL